ncbi:pilus assembly protein PilP [Burkholderiaceae bacterium DAT-1]|nr:pilus assembly protein PilP [Burkholderiaceae bacterium DAT-1]
MRNYLARTSIVLCCLLAACANEEFGDIKTWMSESTKDMKGKMEPLPEVKPYQPLVYNAFDLTDPFNQGKLAVARKGAGGGGALAPDLSRSREILEGYDLEKLKMVGTVMQGKTLSALIQTPDKGLFRVRVGNYIGQNFGVVVSISDADVVLKEIVEDSSGDWVERKTSLALDVSEHAK